MDHYYDDKKCLEDLVDFQTEMMTVAGKLHDLCRMGDKVFERFHPLLKSDRLVEPFREIKHEALPLSKEMECYANNLLKHIHLLSHSTLYGPPF